MTDRPELGALTDRVLLLDKPEGCTSHDVVARLRRFLGLRRIGHAGTLDPFATGLLLLLVGRATKLFPMLSSLDKVYEGRIQLGVETSSGDPAGEITGEAPVPELAMDRLVEVARSLTGEQEQVPPMTSAVKHNGQPLYKLERKGIEVERKSRTIAVHEFEVCGFEHPDVLFRVRCSKGTYVRSLALEFGRRLDVGGHLTSLRRTRIGASDIAQAISMDEAERQEPRAVLARHGLSLSQALGGTAAVRLNPSGVRKVRCGAYPTPADMLDFDAVPDETGCLVQLLDPSGELVAVGRSADRAEGRAATQRIELVRVI